MEKTLMKHQTYRGRRLGVVPAAGQGSRWGGYHKEFLPVNGSFFLNRVIETTYNGSASKCLIISNKDKLSAHKFHLEGVLDEDVLYAIQNDFQKDLWGAIEQSLHYDYDTFLFAMPDTYMPLDIFDREFDKPLYLGTLITSRPERMGVIKYGGGQIAQIVEKPQDWPELHALAWGTVVWNQEVARYWRNNLDRIEDFTQAINMAILEFDMEEFSIDYYHDMASWEDYKEFICSQ